MWSRFHAFRFLSQPMVSSFTCDISSLADPFPFWTWSEFLSSKCFFLLYISCSRCGTHSGQAWSGSCSVICVLYIGRLLKETLGVLLLWACLNSAHSFLRRKHQPVSDLKGVDPGSPLFLTPYLEKGAIDEGKGTLAKANTALSLFLVSGSNVDILFVQPGSWVS